MYLICMKFFFLLTSWYIVFLMRTRNPWKVSYTTHQPTRTHEHTLQATYTHDKKYDTIQMRYIIGPCIFLAFLFHYERPHHEIVEMLWTFSQYLEAVAIVPQLWLLTQTVEQGGKWELLTGHYVFCLGTYRLFYIMNWVCVDPSVVGGTWCTASACNTHGHTGVPLLGGRSLELRRQHVWHHPDALVHRVLLHLLQGCAGAEGQRTPSHRVMLSDLLDCRAHRGRGGVGGNTAATAGHAFHGPATYDTVLRKRKEQKQTAKQIYKKKHESHYNLYLSRRRVG